MSNWGTRRVLVRFIQAAEECDTTQAHDMLDDVEMSGAASPYARVVLAAIGEVWQIVRPVAELVDQAITTEAAGGLQELAIFLDLATPDQ